MSQLESRPIRLLIVDDHKVVRLGLHTLLSRHAGIEVVGEAGTMAAAVEETARLQPDVVLMDVRLPDGNGFEACRQIRKSQLETRVLFLTSFADEEIVLESIDAGGDGYLLKEIDPRSGCDPACVGTRQEPGHSLHHQTGFTFSTGAACPGFGRGRQDQQGNRRGTRLKRQNR